jgi:N-hydroxyarylamine O-acetyltransferase
LKTDEWRSDSLDLGAYLGRVDYRGRLDTDGRTLSALHRAHVAAIPFENFDVILGRGIAVDLENVQAKLVDRRRGGYCYEHATLFGAVLDQLGYQVDRLLARTGDPLEQPRPRSHMVLRVAAGQERWLADVGFGSGLLTPLPLAPTGPRQQGRWMYELVKGPDSAWRLREHDGTGWTTIQTFTEEPQYFVDVDVANYNTATHPNSPFVQRAILVRKDETSVRRLLGREYTVLRPGQPTEQRQLTDQELAALLRAELGGALSDSDVDALVGAADSTAGPPEADEGPR